MKVAGSSERLLLQTFARLDAKALGVAVGVWSGSTIFATTIFLLIKGGSPIGPTLGLLSQYFSLYTVTWGGSIVGFAYGLVFGFLIGWSIAFLRNLLVSVYLHLAKLKAYMSSANDFLDNP
jgi:hypothetical protein